MVVIPFKDFPSFTEEVTLDGLPYRLTFYWNTREEAWFMDIRNREETLLLAGVKLVIMYPLCFQYVDELLPPGEFMVIDDSIDTNTERPGRDDFVETRRLQLIYATEADIEAI